MDGTAGGGVTNSCHHLLFRTVLQFRSPFSLSKSNGAFRCICWYAISHTASSWYWYRVQSIRKGRKVAKIKREAKILDGQKLLEYLAVVVGRGFTDVSKEQLAARHSVVSPEEFNVLQHNSDYQSHGAVSMRQEFPAFPNVIMPSCLGSRRFTLLYPSTYHKMFNPPPPPKKKKTSHNFIHTFLILTF